MTGRLFERIAQIAPEWGDQSWATASAGGRLWTLLSAFAETADASLIQDYANVIANSSADAFYSPMQRRYMQIVLFQMENNVEALLDAKLELESTDKSNYLNLLWFLDASSIQMAAQELQQHPQTGQQE